MDVENSIKLLIAKGKTEDAVKLLLNISSSREILILSNRLSRLKIDKREGVLTNEEYAVQLNKINVEILGLFDKETIDRTTSKSIDYEFITSLNKPSNLYLFLIGGALIVAISIFVYILFPNNPGRSMQDSTKERVERLDQESNTINTECTTNILTEEHSIFWDCIDTHISNREFEKAIVILEMAKNMTNDSDKTKDINDKINDIEIIAKLRLDDAIGYFSENLTITVKNKKEGLVRKDGKVIFEPIFESINPQDFYPLIEIVKYGKIGFIDTVGNYIFYPKFSNANPQEYYPLISVEENEKIGFINKSGEILVPLELDSVMYESDGMIGVLKQDKWGYIDTTGIVRINHRYSSVGYFEGGLAKVRENNNEFLINKQGKKVSE